jgi:MFS family permease
VVADERRGRAISGIYFAGYIVAVPVLSSLTDRLDPRRIYVASLLFGAAAALGFALLANGAASASLWRFLQGAAFGGAHMPGMRALADAVPTHRQTRSVAVYTATFTVGVSLSFALSGLLADTLGWRLGLALVAAGPQRSGGPCYRRCRAPLRKARAGYRHSVRFCATGGRSSMSAPTGCTMVKSRPFARGSLRSSSSPPIARGGLI